MGIELKDWLAHVAGHPLKFRFEGLGRPGDKDSFHKTVGRAAVADAHFMNDYIDTERTYYEQTFDAAVAAREDRDEVLSQFCSFVIRRMSAHDWHEHGFVSTNWDTAPIESIMAIVDAVGAKLRDDYINDWCMQEPSFYRDLILCDDEAPYLLEKHPPVAVWSRSFDEEVALTDVFFLCPSCREPQTEELLNQWCQPVNGFPGFYCGNCGSEMQGGPHEHIVDFFTDLDITVYPFEQAKKEAWAKRKADRKAWGQNKLEIKVGDKVQLLAHQDVPCEHNPSLILRRWSSGPGDVATVCEVRNVTTVDGEITTHAGIVTEEQGFFEFNDVLGLAESEAVSPPATSTHATKENNNVEDAK